MSEKPDFMKKARVIPKGFTFDAFQVDMEIDHHWGRTLSEVESVLFSTLTLTATPTYFNVEYAKTIGHDRIPLNPYLVYLTVFGLSVEDLTEGGRVGALVAIEDLRFHRDCYPGDTFTAKSIVTAKRVSSKNPEMGLVTWRTRGFDQRGDLVVEYTRTNMMNTGS